ncbi:MAG: GerMN domain-containing protein [Fimbriimonas ginsengisoli]|uniref:GerMN domain-containing protein n=1 Tax=Fimbriimonas ginsengisoli TaxID=1005039 RepID=A0A931PVC8_FIMGI|nr:GerMN domain-containing protein [Fimbriimonas ginsengisoli]MBI3722244.1 GerMN domain-containing protein [Fimbriimonas ginsengisoli]
MLLLAVALSGAAALGLYVNATRPAQDAAGSAVRRGPQVGVTATHQGQGSRVAVLTPHTDGLEVSFTQEQRELPAGADAKVFAVNGYLRQLKSVPPEAEMLSVDLQGRTAILQFNEAFRQTYGSIDEKIILDGLRATLGLFPEVDSIRLYIGGNALDSLGHADLDEPLPVIRAAPPAQAPSPQP